MAPRRVLLLALLLMAAAAAAVASSPAVVVHAASRDHLPPAVAASTTGVEVEPPTTADGGGGGGLTDVPVPPHLILHPDATTDPAIQRTACGGVTVAFLATDADDDAPIAGADDGDGDLLGDMVKFFLLGFFLGFILGVIFAVVIDHKGFLCGKAGKSSGSGDGGAFLKNNPEAAKPRGGN